MWISDHGGAWRAARRALELAERLDDPEVYCRALFRVGWRELERPGRGLATIETAAAAAEGLAREELVGDVYLAVPSGDVGAQLRRRAPRIRGGPRVLPEKGNELNELYLLAYRALFELGEGRWSEAAETATRVIGRRAVSTYPRTVALSVLARVRARRGDPDVLPLLAEARALAESTGELPRLATVAVAEAEAAWLRGDPKTALEATAEALALAVAVGEGSDVACLQAWRRRAGIEELPHPLADGPYALELAGEAAAASAAWADRGRPYEAALALADVGSETALREALGALAELGATAAAAIVAHRLRARGARDIPRGPRPSTRLNAAGLTARESEILALVVEGLRNREIAQRLFLSPRTVENHVSAILGKLGARSRSEAAAEAARLGLLQDA